MIRKTFGVIEVLAIIAVTIVSIAIGVLIMDITREIAIDAVPTSTTTTTIPPGDAPCQTGSPS